MKKGLRMPFWWRTMMREKTPDEWVYRHGARIEGTSQGTQTWTTMFKHLSLIDINRVFQCVDQVVANTSGSQSGSRNSVKAYIEGLQRKHMFRNSTTGDVQVHFYTLTPRRAYPAYAVDSATGLTPVAMSGICPPTTNDYATGALREDPALSDFGIRNIIANLGGTNIKDTTMFYTPYMNPVLTRMFKIRPLKVAGPGGKKSFHRLGPGQECVYVGKRMKPVNISRAKYGFVSTGGTTFKFTDMYNAVPECPLILMSLAGTTIHSSIAQADVDIGQAWLDYTQFTRMRFWHVSETDPQFTNDWTSNPPTIAAANQEQIQPVTASAVVAQNP